jgi:hypothetical protein
MNENKTGNTTITCVQDLTTDILPSNILQGTTEVTKTIEVKAETQRESRKRI